ncbi:MAG TPA: type II toxin-antitoxin system VapC family toxin [Leptolinea sp.]
MNLIDSSGWFEYFINSSNARHFVPVIENMDELIISPLNFFEIYKRVQREFGADEANRAVGFLKNARVVDISTSIALAAAELSKIHHLHMADSFLLATAQSEDAVLWTMDSHFKDIPGVQYFAKE